MEKHTNSKASILRQKTEGWLKKQSMENPDPVLETETLRLLHELEAYQIELDMINDELLQAKDKEAIAAKKYMELYDFAPTGYFSISTDDIIIQLNLMGAKMLGKERSLLLNRRFAVLISEDSKAGYNQFLERLRTSNIQKTCELSIQTPDGSSTHFQLTGITSENREYFLISMFDISKRKQAQESLSLSEKKMEDIIFCAGDRVWEMDENGIYTSSVNKGINKFGYRDDEIVGKSMYDFMLPEEAKRIRAIFSEIAANKLNIKDLEKWYIQKDGKIICLLTNGIPILDKDGNMKGYRGIDKDISEYKKAEAEIRERAVQYSNLANSGLSLLWTSGTDKLCNYFNNSWLSFTGRSLEQEIGDGWTDGVHPDDIAGCVKTYLTAFEKKEPFEMEYRIMHASGEYKWIVDLGTPNYSGAGEFIGYIGNCFDITERKQAEHDLRLAKEKAEESDYLKSAFLSNMSHEIRTPMNGILGFTQLLKTPDLSGEELQDYVRIIEKSGARMLNIINDIIDISKIESGLMKIDISKSNINEQSDYIYTFFKPETERKGLKFHYRKTLQTKEATINTDREKLFAILTNLVKNAIKYTDEGSIEFGYVSTGSTTGTGSAVGELVEPELEFYVKDTGIGIRTDRQQAIFERFFQADTSDSRAYQGAGLGLSISKAYVEMLGGKMRVESEYGIGSTFYFTLPYPGKLAEQIPVLKRKPVKTLTDQVQKLKVLIAEDDETSKQLLNISLRSIGKEIITVGTGIEAIETCRNNPDIDLVLMDIQMPVMDGYEATRQIRQFNKKIIIIAQTAFGLSDDPEKAVEAGCNDYILKPIIKGQLQNVIEKYF
jgi:PAS domain S-box-containing protein